MKKFASVFKKLTCEENGQVLVLVLVVLLVGALLMGALMGLVGTGITTGTVYENRTSSLYAADSGVQDAIWQLNNTTGNAKVPNPNDTNYSLTENNYLVNVSIHLQDSVPTYRIIATATKTGSLSTTVTAYVQPNNGSPIFNDAINATGNITFNAGNASITGDVFSQSGQIIFPGSGSNTLNGDVYAPGGIPSGGKGTIDGTVTVNTGSTVSSSVSNSGVTTGSENFIPPTTKMTKLDNQVQSDATIAPTGISIIGPVTLSNLGSSSNPYAYPAISDPNQSEYYVSGDLNFTNGNYITFNEPVYVTGNVSIAGNPNIVFNDGVYIGGNLNISSNSLQEFSSTLYVGGNLISNGRVQADNAEYIGGALTLTNGAYVYESTSAATADNKVIVVDGAISMSGGTSLGNTNQIPLIIDLSTSPVTNGLIIV
jgi:hypothetical protein